MVGIVKINHAFYDSLYFALITNVLCWVGEPDRLPVYEDRLVIGGSDFVGWVLYLYAAGVCRKGGFVFTIKGGQLSFAGQDPESPT